MPGTIKASEEKGEFTVVNIYEELVRENVLTMMAHMNVCNCQKCLSDACALVLNQLTPHYVTTRKGELLSQLPQMQRENHVDLTVKVVHALNMVKESPRH